MDYKIIAERLKELRAEHNLKQDDIAKVLGVDRTAYSGYETGRTKLSLRNLCCLADIYNISLNALIGKPEKDEITRVRTMGVASGVDPIALFERDEQLLIMYYRLADEEGKKQILKVSEEIRRSAEGKEND